MTNENFVGGVPQEAFRMQGTREVISRSKQTLRVTSTPTKWSIVPEDSDRIHFVGELVDLSLRYRHIPQMPNDNYTAVTFDIFNKGSSGKDGRHPDINASALFQKTLQYFEQQNHKQMPYIMAQWRPNEGSDNYSSYQNYLTKITTAGKEPTYRQKLQAARQTWTGQQAKRNGYRHIGALLERPNGSLEVIFANSRQARIQIQRLTSHLH